MGIQPPLDKRPVCSSRVGQLIWPNHLVTSMDRFDKGRNKLRGICRQIFYVVICKSVVCRDIRTGDFVDSYIFSQRSRRDGKEFSTLVVIFGRPLWCFERCAGDFCK